jgi:hypothetical protein
MYWKLLYSLGLHALFNSILIMISVKIMDGETFCTYSASTIASLSGHLDPVLRFVDCVNFKFWICVVLIFRRSPVSLALPFSNTPWAAR